MTTPTPKDTTVSQFLPFALRVAEAERLLNQIVVDMSAANTPTPSNSKLLQDLEQAAPSTGDDLREAIGLRLEAAYEGISSRVDERHENAVTRVLSVIAPLLDAKDRDYAREIASLQQMADYCRAKDSAEVERLRDLLGNIELYTDWRYITGKLSTDQRELWADAVVEWSARMHDETPDPARADRWWRDAAPVSSVEPDPECSETTDCWCPEHGCVWSVRHVIDCDGTNHQTEQVPPREPRVWQPGDPEPDDNIVLLHEEADTEGLPYLARVARDEWEWRSNREWLPRSGYVASAVRSWDEQSEMAKGPLTEVIEQAPAGQEGDDRG